MTDQQIVREYDPAVGQWVTRVQAEPGAGATPTLEEVLQAGDTAGSETITVGGTTLKDLFGSPAAVPVANTDPGLVVSGKQGAPDSLAVFQVWDDDFNTNSPFNVFHAGQASVQEVANNTRNGPTLLIQGRASPNDIVLQAQHSTTALFQIAKSTGMLFNRGALSTARNTAPADGDLGANQVAIWFDSTNGAAKLMIKGKSADGTVVSGEVALT